MPSESLRRSAKLRDGPRLGLAAAVAVALAVALFGALGVTASQVSALTPTLPPTSTPTQTPTPTPEPTLIWTIEVSPASPVVGDDIKVTAYASGDGGLPQYTLTLKDDPALLTLESAASVTTGGPLGVPASWDLGTLGAGKAHFNITVNYEREFCTPTNCFFAFTNESAPETSVEIDLPSIGGIVLDGNPAMLPLDEARSGDVSTTAIAMIGFSAAAALLAVGTLAWLLRKRVVG